jgi:hypothetical protein
MPNPGDIRAARVFIELFVEDSKVVRGLRKAAYQFETFGRTWQRAGLWTMGAGVAIIGGLVAAGKQFADVGLEIQAMSKRTGIGVEAMSALAYAAKMSAVDIDTLQVGIRRMEFNIRQLEEGASEVVKTFKDLKVTWSDLKDLKPQDQFLLIADSLQKVQNVSERGALAQGVFGRGGTRLLPMGDAARIGELTGEARTKGLVPTEAEVSRAVELKMTMVELTTAMKQLAFTVGSNVAPMMQLAAKSLAEYVEGMVRAQRESPNSVSTLMSIGSAAIGAGAAMTALGLGTRAVAFGIAVLVAPVGLLMAGLVALSGAAAGLGLMAEAQNEAWEAETKRVEVLAERYKELRDAKRKLTPEEEVEMAAAEPTMIERLQNEVRMLVEEWNKLDAKVQAGRAAWNRTMAPEWKMRMKEIESEVAIRADQLEALRKVHEARKTALVDEERGWARGEMERRWAEELATVRAKAIKDELEQEIELINLRYEAELRKAEQVLADTTDLRKAQIEEISQAEERATEKAQKEELDFQKRTLDANLEAGNKRRSLEDEIARARIEATMAGAKKDAALLELERSIAIREGAAAGLDVDLINQFFDWRRAAMKGGGVAYGGAGTFEAGVSWGLGGGSVFERIARATEEMARKMGTKGLIDTAYPPGTQGELNIGTA